MKEDYKSGYVGKDAMRSKAEKAMGDVQKESLKVKMPTSAVDKEKMRPFKKGGCVTKMAAGGAGKVRKKVATPAGKPIAQPKKKGK